MMIPRRSILAATLAAALAVGGLVATPTRVHADENMMVGPTNCDAMHQQVDYYAELYKLACMSGALSTGFGILAGANAALLCGSATAAWEMMRAIAWSAGC